MSSSCFSHETAWHDWNIPYFLWYHSTVCDSIWQRLQLQLSKCSHDNRLYRTIHWTLQRNFKFCSREPTPTFSLRSDTDYIPVLSSFLSSELWRWLLCLLSKERDRGSWEVGTQCDSSLYISWKVCSSPELSQLIPTTTTNHAFNNYFNETLIYIRSSSVCPFCFRFPHYNFLRISHLSRTFQPNSLTIQEKE
jgi:hypothetical protein